MNITLSAYAGGFSKPTDIASTGIPGDGRLFIVEQIGTIRIIAPGGTVQSTPFLDIRGQVGSQGSEQGLLGLAFHPAYGENGYFYVNYTNLAGDTRISRFRMDPLDDQLADPDSEKVILAIDQPFPNHNAGDLAFGPDGYLYIPVGDGGSAEDPGNRAQDLRTLLGKLLRIDVGSPAGDTSALSNHVFLPHIAGPGVPYTIPPDNPYAVDDDPDTLPEIWASGLRNPWRISFDRQTGDLYMGDVGQYLWEEIDYQIAGSPGGENYGWRCYEGFHPFNLQGCGAPDGYVFPIVEYEHGSECSVTGGFVYRGLQYPALHGQYLFADYCSSRFWSLTPDGNGGWQLQDLGVPTGLRPSSFGEAADGEVFVAGRADGTIYQILGE